MVWMVEGVRSRLRSALDVSGHSVSWSVAAPLQRCGQLFQKGSSRIGGNACERAWTDEQISHCAD
jgi:hypothetical protein